MPVSSDDNSLSQDGEVEITRKALEEFGETDGDNATLDAITVKDECERQESVMDENEHQAFEDEAMSLETDISPFLCEATMNGQCKMLRVEEGIISQSNAYQSAPSPPEAFLAIITMPEGVSFPCGAEVAVEEEQGQKHDDYIPIKTAPDDLPATSKIESIGVECSAGCGEQSSTIIKPEKGTRTEKGRFIL